MLMLSPIHRITTKPVWLDSTPWHPPSGMQNSKSSARCFGNIGSGTVLTEMILEKRYVSGGRKHSWKTDLHVLVFPGFFLRLQVCLLLVLWSSGPVRRNEERKQGKKEKQDSKQIQHILKTRANNIAFWLKVSSGPRRTRASKYHNPWSMVPVFRLSYSHTLPHGRRAS